MGSSVYLRMSYMVTLLLNVPDQLELTELHLGMSEEETMSLWVRIKGRAGTGDIIVGVCYRPPKQEYKADESLSTDSGSVSDSQALVLMGGFKHFDICWRSNTRALLPFQEIAGMH